MSAQLQALIKTTMIDEGYEHPLNFVHTGKSLKVEITIVYDLVPGKNGRIDVRVEHTTRPFERDGCIRLDDYDTWALVVVALMDYLQALEAEMRDPSKMTPDERNRLAEGHDVYGFVLLNTFKDAVGDTLCVFRPEPDPCDGKRFAFWRFKHGLTNNPFRVFQSDVVVPVIKSSRTGRRLVEGSIE